MDSLSISSGEGASPSNNRSNRLRHRLRQAGDQANSRMRPQNAHGTRRSGAPVHTNRPNTGLFTPNFKAFEMQNGETRQQHSPQDTSQVFESDDSNISSSESIHTQAQNIGQSTLLRGSALGISHTQPQYKNQDDDDDSNPSPMPRRNFLERRLGNLGGFKGATQNLDDLDDEAVGPQGRESLFSRGAVLDGRPSIADQTMDSAEKIRKNPLDFSRLNLNNRLQNSHLPSAQPASAGSSTLSDQKSVFDDEPYGIDCQNVHRPISSGSDDSGSTNTSDYDLVSSRGAASSAVMYSKPTTSAPPSFRPFSRGLEQLDSNIDVLENNVLDTDASQVNFDMPVGLKRRDNDSEVNNPVQTTILGLYATLESSVKQGIRIDHLTNSERSSIQPYLMGRINSFQKGSFSPELSDSELSLFKKRLTEVIKGNQKLINEQFIQVMSLKGEKVFKRLVLDPIPGLLERIPSLKT